MSDINEIERKAQNRVVALIRDELKYEYGGNLRDRANSNIDEVRLSAFLRDPSRQACSDALAAKVLHKLQQVANDKTKTLYDRNRAVYDLLRYGVNVLPDVGEQTVTIKIIDWENPLENDFMVAEEVTVVGPTAVKRPDVVLYVNGIALSVLELKRSTISVSEGIRQNLDNQRPEFIEHFFSTIQWVMAGNDSQGLRYGTIETPEKYYLTWREDGDEENILDRAILQVCEKSRLLEFIHDFIVFDAGIKKVCRHNQYFGVRASETAVANRAGGVIWHTQGSGKSLTMVWLAQWIREHVADSRVLIVTDRKELDQQIEGVFQGVGADIYRTTSGADLIGSLNASNPWLLCSLIHKFANRRSDDEADQPGYIRELRAALPENFAPKGDIFVFIDECHRSQSNLLHKAMKEILPEAVFIGFTGTPLLKKDKARSIEIFGPYIHTYKFDEAVRDGVIVDLRYEARDIDQHISDPEAIDRWFAAKTKGLNDIAKAQLKKRWGTMQEVLSSNSRLSRIVSDVVVDMNTRERLASGRGNAILVTASIRDACEIFEQFQKTELKGHCGIITSYAPRIADLKGETTGEGETVTEKQYNVYRQMLTDWFKISPYEAMGKAEIYETEAKARFIKEPGQLKLLIVVDKLLTGFDAPPATYLYIDKHMQDHGLFQAICRVNRLDGEDKDYGYIVDYKDLFRSLEGAVRSYTGEAFSGLDADDVAGLLKDRVAAAKAELDDAREAVRALVEPVTLPRSQAEYRHYFCTTVEGDASQLQSNEPKRLAFYKAVGAFLRAFANVANDYTVAEYSDSEIEKIRSEIDHFEAARTYIRLASGDFIDLKLYEPAMRFLMDSYIDADASRKISTFDDMSFVDLLVERGPAAVELLPEPLRSPEAVAETIANNVRRLIIDEHPINPKYYDLMSDLLDALIEQRRLHSIDYQRYLEEISNLAKMVKDPTSSGSYPSTIDSRGRQAIFDLVGRDEQLALRVDSAIRSSLQDGWRDNPFKIKLVRQGIASVIIDNEVEAEEILELVKAHGEY